MAHMSEGKGPFPDKAGEYCGNHFPNAPPPCHLHQSPLDAEREQRIWLAKMRFGKPGATAAYTSAEIADMGGVGVFLKADRELHEGETPVETDALTEAVVSTREYPSAKG